MTKSLVRKHRAPKGALRLPIVASQRQGACVVRKHRAPKGALRPLEAGARHPPVTTSQKAPSAKRCIKTDWRCDPTFMKFSVRKHRAPKGALRRPQRRLRQELNHHVRKHRAPKGALRHREGTAHTQRRTPVRKHRAPKGALRRVLHAADRALDRRKVRKHRAPKGALRPPEETGPRTPS